jgi:hypothetical protein
VRPPPRRRDRGFLSGALVLGALVLLVAILIGNRLGDKVLTQVVERTQPIATLPTPFPQISATLAPATWKVVKVVSVATDPHFPDPRVTPPPPTPTPTPKHTPTPRPSQEPSPEASTGLDQFVPLPSPGAPTPPPTFTPPPPQARPAAPR